MKYSERLRQLSIHFTEKHERRQCEKYENLILSGKLRIWDVPLKWRRNPHTALLLYITGFRVARGISLERYEDDLAALKTELLLFEHLSSHNPALLSRLSRLYGERKAELDHCRWRQHLKKGKIQVTQPHHYSAQFARQNF